MAGKLYLVATPIGNLEDITLRAIRILKEVDIIAAEDTRQTLKLLNHLEINKPLISYHRHNEETRGEELLKLLEEGKSIALVSDAGTPVISDPGEEIVKIAIEHEIEIIPIPGPCALITAIITSGLDTKEFQFLGFLPLHKKTRKQKLEEIQKVAKTTILYEAPHKLKNTLEELIPYVGDRQLVLAKELTKIHETFIRGTLQEVIQKCENVKGEFIILIEGNAEVEEETWENVTLEEHYKKYEQVGMEKKEIIKQIAKDRKVSKNEIYQYFL